MYSLLLRCLAKNGVFWWPLCCKNNYTVFHQLVPLGRVGLVVAMSVCLSVCLSVCVCVVLRHRVHFF